jgi:D-alanyl-D-alanine carboxypeptidase
MNACARSLGCVSTVFVNPHGLDGVGVGAREQRSCAGDIARIAAIAMCNSTFVRVVRCRVHRALVWRSRAPAAAAPKAVLAPSLPVPVLPDAETLLPVIMTPLAAAAAAAVAAAAAAATAAAVAGAISDAASDRSQVRIPACLFAMVTVCAAAVL